jgi:peptide/nickel transport system permease protein
MIAWLVRRLAWSVLVLTIVSTATFAIFFAIPNDPAALVAGKYATPETVALVRTPASSRWRWRWRRRSRARCR